MPLYSLNSLEWLMPRSYISQIFCFPSCDARTPQALKSGLAGTVSDIPYLLCGVLDREHPKGAVDLSEEYQCLDDLFIYRDLSAQVSYDSLRSQNFPPSHFNELDIYPHDLGPSNGNPAPIFRAVLSLVEHGYLLYVSVHHSTTDITGFDSLLNVWASHCRTASSKDIGFDRAWFDRRALFHSRTLPTNSLPKLLHFQNTTDTIGPGTPMETCILTFRGQHLQRLKSEISTQSTSAGIPWLSTGDILTALLWSALVAAEFQEGVFPGVGKNEGGTESVLRFPVDFRARYQPALQPGYLGAAFGVTSARARQSDLFQVATSREQSSLLPSLAKVAASIRKAIAIVDATEMKRVMNYLESQKDIRQVRLGPEEAKMSIVSWAHQKVYGLDWGDIVGSCEAMRLPKFKARRYPIVLPKQTNGDLDVILSLDVKVMNRLKGVWAIEKLQREL